MSGSDPCFAIIECYFTHIYIFTVSSDYILVQTYILHNSLPTVSNDCHLLSLLLQQGLFQFSEHR